MYGLGKCVVIVEDGEVLAPVRVEHLHDEDGEAKVDGKWVSVRYVGRVNGKLVWQQEQQS